MRKLSGIARDAIRGMVLVGVLSAASTIGLEAASGQVVSSDETAGLIIFPKILVHTTAVGANPVATTVQQDTLLQLTNTNTTESAALRCYYVNANGHCSNDETFVCYSNAECGLGNICTPGWSVRDFDIVLTPEQPIGWLASQGLELPCFGNPDPPVECRVDPDTNLAFENEGAIPPVQEDPFRGELKCIQVTSLDEDVPSGRNDVKGEATLYRSSLDGITTATYNAIGFQTLTADPGDAPTAGDPPLPLCLGTLTGLTCGQSYVGCPGILILNHFFEGAAAPFGAGDINTELTLVPCTENLASDNPADQVVTTAQLLIYNEFEQRFSTSRRVQCYANVRLSDIDTQPGTADDSGSIFSASVQGTLAGQTRIRGVQGSETTVGHGLIAVAQELYSLEDSVYATSAFNLQFTGSRSQGDAISR